MPRSLTLLLNPRTNLRLITSAKSRERKEETRLGLTPLAHAQHNRENQEPNSRMTAFRRARLSLVLNENGSRLEGPTVTWPTHNRTVLQLVRPTLTLRNYMMRLPSPLPVPSTAKQTKRDPARNSMLMISQYALTSRHRPYPCVAQDFRREGQLSSRASSAKLSHL